MVEVGNLLYLGLIKILLETAQHAIVSHLKILILNSGGAQIRRYNGNVVLAFISFVLVVKGVKVVIGVKVKCKRSACEKNQQD